jgi:phosphoglycerate dehydrogenase-like enzyme
VAGRDPASLVIRLTGEVTSAQLAQIESAVPGADVRYHGTRSHFEADLGEAEIVAGSIASSGFRRAPRLRWFQSWAAGVDSQLIPELLASDVVVTSVKSNGAVPLAEHVMMLMLMLNRDAPRWLRAQAESRWEKRTHGEVAGLTLGIIGLGYAGQELAKRARAFDMRVIGVRRTAHETPNVDVVYPRERLHDFLAESDVVAMMAPRTPETLGMLGEAEFRVMKRTALYVCVSRGGIADDSALVRALREGWIAGAGLDAHAIEPLPADSPFWTMPNTIVTPHNGAANPKVRQRGIDIFIENLGRFVAGEPLLNVVDKRTGY